MCIVYIRRCFNGDVENRVVKCKLIIMFLLPYLVRDFDIWYDFILEIVCILYGLLSILIMYSHLFPPISKVYETNLEKNSSFIFQRSFKFY